MSAISGLLSSLNSAKDIAQAMIGLHDSQAFKAKAIEFESKVLDAYKSAFAAEKENSALLKQISLLEKKVADMKTWQTQKKCYELKEVGSNRFLAYALKPEAQSTEPMHYVCANCYKNGKASILQPQTLAKGRARLMVCHECNTEFVKEGWDDRKA